jgi:hypothetical protein|tara:strand:+ start:779 stop:2209 length:1431 start_codon:yes stop_codon:yes gene_type:complete
MSEVRPYRLLNAVENGTVLGPELNTILGDAGRLAEWTVLYAQRGQAKRISNGATTMLAITNSLIATNAAFLQATVTNDTIVAAVAKSAIAMAAVSDVSSVLQTVSGNPTAWGYFYGSDFYESHIKKIIAHLSGIDPSVYASTNLLITDPVSMGDISVSEQGMRALVNSLPSATIMAGSSVAMPLVAANSIAINLVAQQTNIMPTIAASATAMGNIVSYSVAMNAMSINAGAIQAIGANAAAWTSFKSSAHFSTDLKDVVANLAGLIPSDYASIDAIIANEAALTAVAANAQASDALSTSSAATTTLASSPNLSIILGSATAMTYYGTEANIQAFLTVPAAVPVVFGSSVAKGIIVASDTLIDFIAATSSITSYLGTIATTAIPSNLNAVGTNNVFGGFPDKFIILSIRANNIGAIPMDFTLAGSPLAGTTYSNIVSPSGTVTKTIALGLSNPATWKASGIAATAAASPETTYVDMT